MSKFDIISFLDKLVDYFEFAFRNLFFVGLFFMSCYFFQDIKDPILLFLAAFSICSIFVLNTKQHSTFNNLISRFFLFLLCTPFLTLLIELVIRHTIIMLVDVVLISILLLSYLYWEWCRTKGWYRGLIVSRTAVLSFEVILISFNIGTYAIALFYEKIDVTYLSALGCIELASILFMLLAQTYQSPIHILPPISISCDILYLRSFETDSKDKRHIKEISKCAEKESARVFAIAEPKTFMKAITNLHVIYLPTTNWKKAVHNYIKRMNTVVVNFSTSNGILWEIIRHQQYNEKIIYCADRKDDLCRFIDFLRNTDVSKLSSEAQIILPYILASFQKVYNYVCLKNTRESCIYFKLTDQSIYFSTSFEKIYNGECDIINCEASFLTIAR